MEKKEESNQLLTSGKWFEEFETGQQLNTASRTITEADVVNFAGLSGDFNPVHIDAEFGKQSIYGERVAHGLLVLSIATGLLVQTGMLDGTLGAFREIKRWKFRQPVYIGDTVCVVMDVANTKAVPRMEGGLVEFKLDVTNQRDEVVMTGLFRVFMLSESAEL
jgi:acyl dehydratase